GEDARPHGLPRADIVLHDRSQDVEPASLAHRVHLRPGEGPGRAPVFRPLSSTLTDRVPILRVTRRRPVLRPSIDGPWPRRDVQPAGGRRATPYARRSPARTLRRKMRILPDP